MALQWDEAVERDAQALGAKLAALRHLLSPGEQVLLDRIVVAATGKDADVQGYDFSAAAFQRAVQVVALAAGFDV